MTGACAGCGSGAGIRLSKAGVGADGPSKVVGLVGLRTWLAWPELRAKPGADPATQAAANAIAKSSRMIVFLLGSTSPSSRDVIIASGYSKMSERRPAPKSTTRTSPADAARCHSSGDAHVDLDRVLSIAR